MKVRQLILDSSKIKELNAFYSLVLDLPVTTGNNSFSIRIGTSHLVFKQAESADPFYHFAINIPANKIKEAREWLLQKEIPLLWMNDYGGDVADFVNWHAKSVYFFDPAGNILELIARFDLENDSKNPFDSDQFLSINEVGIVLGKDDFDKKATRFLDAFHLSYFDKQAPLPQFRAIGDDEGLFIIVPESRNWYPTQSMSGVFPIEVQFENRNREYTLSLS